MHRYWEKRTILRTADELIQEWAGGCEFETKPGVKWTTFAPPNVSDYHCDFISCNAMKNHGGLDGRQACIAGSGRLIHAKKNLEQPGEGWTFSLDA